mgnify:CR=1 FL=1
MTIWILLIISFILHILSFYFLIVFYTRHQALKNLKEEQENLLKEAEDALTVFLMELKEENQKFLEQMSKNDSPSEAYNLDELVAQQKDSVEITANLQEDEPDSYKRNLQEQVFQLANEGYTIEQIAQKLNVGKTEIELIMKFHKKD